MDFALYKDVNGFAHGHDFFEDVLRFFAKDAPYLFFALLAVLWLARGKYATRSGRHGVAAAGFSALLALGAAQVLSHLVERARPYVAHPHDAYLFVARSTDSSFPSDHATGAFAIATAIWLRNRRVGWLALAMATVVSVARVAVGAHYPGDVLAGAALGALAALALWVPVVRRPLHALADWAGALYERAANAVLRAPSRA